MDHKIGYMVTGYRKYKGEEAECKVGTFTEGTLVKTFADARRAGEIWAAAQKRSFLQYDIDPVYEVEQNGEYVPFEER
jgi:hypothetical protein